MSLYGNINAKKKRIKAGSGETMKPKGAEGRPKASDFTQAAKTAKKRVQKLKVLHITYQLVKHKQARHTSIRQVKL